MAKRQTLYKLTARNNTTRGPTYWGCEVSNRAALPRSKMERGSLCTAAYIHAYEHPVMATIMNVAHAGIRNPKLWLAKGTVQLRDSFLKCGGYSLRTIKRHPLPRMSSEQRARMGVLLALRYGNPNEGYTQWARRWLRTPSWRFNCMLWLRLQNLLGFSAWNYKLTDSQQLCKRVFQSVQPSARRRNKFNRKMDSELATIVTAVARNSFATLDQVVQTFHDARRGAIK